MSDIIGQVEVLNFHSGKAEEALLYDGINEMHIQDFENLWQPVLKNKANEIRARHTNSGDLNKTDCILEMGEYGIQDWSWDWRDICKRTDGQLIYRTFAIECQKKLQGLMLTNLGVPCTMQQQINMPMVYVDRIAVAPWNRIQFNKNINYKYTGKILLAVAISLSIEEDFEGRIGLHSLPQSCEFYEEKIGMTNLGPDRSHENLIYYEMTSEQAKQFLNSES